MSLLWLLLLVPPGYLLLWAVIRWSVARQHRADQELETRTGGFDDY